MSILPRGGDPSAALSTQPGLWGLVTQLFFFSSQALGLFRGPGKQQFRSHARNSMRATTYYADMEVRCLTNSWTGRLCIKV